VLIVRDVLGWSAKETAALLDSSVPSVNSALQRARAALKQHLPERRLEWSSSEAASDEERALLQRYLEASERADADAIAELLAEDAHFSMPPDPLQVTGRREIIESWKSGGFGTEEYRDWRGMVVGANRQPAIAWYLRKPGEAEHRAFALDVLRMEDGAIVDVMAFPGTVLRAFGLPPTA
jgi:RNA polymerase sigma-70 factor, ECF subfamily